MSEITDAERREAAMPSDKRLEEIRKDLQRGTRPWYDTDVEYLLSVLDAARQLEQGAQLGQMVMLLLQNDFEGARQLALEIPLTFPDGTPAAAPTETAASFACVGLEGCQVLEGAISEMFVHDKDCPAFNRPTETAAPQDETRLVDCAVCGKQHETPVMKMFGTTIGTCPELCRPLCNASDIGAPDACRGLRNSRPLNQSDA